MIFAILTICFVLLGIAYVAWDFARMMWEGFKNYRRNNDKH
jgi:hypothetical protein